MPVGGGGLVPNLLAGNVEAAVVYSPLSFQIAKSGEARTILDYAKEVPPNLAAGWIALDKYAQDKPQMVQKTLNALYGALPFMRANKDATVKLIAELYEIPAEIAALEYENTIMKLETDGSMGAPKIPAAAAAGARPGQARRHEGLGAGGRDDLDPVQARSDQVLRPARCKAGFGSKGGAGRASWWRCLRCGKCCRGPASSIRACCPRRPTRWSRSAICCSGPACARIWW